MYYRLSVYRSKLERDIAHSTTEARVKLQSYLALTQIISPSWANFMVVFFVIFGKSNSEIPRIYCIYQNE